MSDRKLRVVRNILLATVLATTCSNMALAANVEKVPHGVVITPDSGPAKRVRVIAYDDRSFRVTAVPHASLDLPDSLMVNEQPHGDVTITQTKGVVTLKAAKATAEIRLSDGHVQFRN
ncbi:MAG: hypothetical protein ABI471_03180, partial [Sphingomonas bacterium]